MKPVLDYVFGKKLDFETSRYLAQLAKAPALASRQKASRFLAEMREKDGPKVILGETVWGEPVEIPLTEIIRSTGLVTAGSGGGKTMFCLLILEAVLENSESGQAGFGVLDGAKFDLYLGALYLVQRRLVALSKADLRAAAKFRRRIRIIDFAAPGDVVSPFNILCPWPNADLEGFAGYQLDLLLDVLPDADGLKLAAAPLKTLVQILASPEVAMTIIDLIRCLDDEPFLDSVTARCGDRELVERLRRQLSTVSKSTLAALRRRLEVLVSSRTVARSLSCPTAPDFRAIQDAGCFLLINCAGPAVPPGVARFLNTLAVSNFCPSIYARQNPALSFLGLADEAQDLFNSSSVLREHLSDAARLSRRYGTNFVFITQNLHAAVSDARLLSLLHTNVAWSWSGRGDPADCAFLRGALPVTGRRPRPKQHPFEESTFYTAAEERTLLLEEIANLPNRTGYLWLKGRSPEAIKIRARQLDIPQGRDLEEATAAIRRDPTIGGRLSRKEYERLVAQRERRASPERGEDFGEKLAGAYRSARGRQKS